MIKVLDLMLKIKRTQAVNREFVKMVLPMQGQAGSVKLGPFEHLPSYLIGVRGDSSLVASFSKTAHSLLQCLEVSSLKNICNSEGDYLQRSKHKWARKIKAFPV